MAGLVESFCVKMLPETSVEFMTGLCDECRIVVPEGKAEDHSYLVKVLLRHLTSAEVEESPDHGVAKFLKLYNELGEELKTTNLQPKREQAPTGGGGAGHTVSESL